MSNRYYQSENCAETINKEFSMAETFWPNKTNNATNSFPCKNDNLKFENELLDYPLRDIGEKCGEIFILNCSGDVVYSCQFCEDYFINIGKLIHHCYDQHGFKDNRPKEILNEVLNKNRIETFLETQNEFQIEREENDGDTSNQNVNENFGDNSNQINQEHTQVNLQTSTLPKLIQTPSGQKYILVSTPVINNSFAHQQPQPMHFQQPTQTFGIVNPQFTNSFAQIPQNQSFIYNSPIHTGVQTAFVNTPPHNVPNMVGGTSSERVPDDNVQMTSFDNLIEFDSGSNSNQSPSNPLHKDVGNTIEEIVANYPDDDNVLPPTAEQFVITSEETSNQCAQTFQDHETGNSDIISGNKIEALIEELVNSNSNSQHNYVSENENNQTPIVLSGNHPQTLYVQNPAFFATNVQSNPDTNLVNQHIIAHQGQQVLLNNEGVQQNYIFDGQNLQPTNFVNTTNNQNHSSNLYIKFNENDGNIYLLNGFNNNLNINGIIDSNNQIQITTQNETETVVADEINIPETEVTIEHGKTTSDNNTSTSCEPILHNFLNDSPGAHKLLQTNSDDMLNNKLPNNLGDHRITIDNNIQMQHVSAEEIVAGSSTQMHDHHQQQQLVVMQTDNDINMQTDEQSQGPILQASNEVNAMDISETDSTVILNSSRQNIQKNDQDNNKTSKDLFSSKKSNEPKFLDNFQKFLENKREQEMTTGSASVGGSITTALRACEEEDDDEGAGEDDEENDTEKQLTNIRTMTEKNQEAFNNKNHSCKICGRDFKEEFHLKLHNDRSPPIKCEECNLLFCSSKLFNKHTKSHKNDETPVIKCDLCSLTFRSQHFLEMHMKNHNDIRPFKCNICKSTFRFQRFLDLHMNRHLGKRPYACNFCEKCFFTGTERSQHELYHLGKGCTFKCKQCDKDFSQRSSLVNHSKTHNNNSNSGKTSTITTMASTSTQSSTSPILLSSKTTETNNSSELRSTITTPSALSLQSSSEQQQQQEQLDISNSSGSSNQQCNLCNLNFKTIELLQQHHQNIHNQHHDNTLTIQDSNIHRNSSINNINNDMNNDNNDHIMEFSSNSNLMNNDINNDNNINNSSNNNNLNIEQIINNDHTNSNNSSNSNNNTSNNSNNIDKVETILRSTPSSSSSTSLLSGSSLSGTISVSTSQYLNCHYCDNKFINIDLLNEHINYCHTTTISTSTTNSIMNTTTNNTLIIDNNKCKKCNLILRNPNELTNHLNNRGCCIEEEIDVVL